MPKKGAKKFSCKEKRPERRIYPILQPTLYLCPAESPAKKTFVGLFRFVMFPSSMSESSFMSAVKIYSQFTINV